MTNQTNGNATTVSGVDWNFTYLGANSAGAGLNFEGFNLTLAADGDPKLALRTRNFSNQLAAGSTVWYRFWLSVPSTQVSGTYAGNYTHTCIAATT